MKTVALIGTLDTKGEEYAYLKNILTHLGLGVFTVHTGAFAPRFAPDVSNETVARAAGAELSHILESHDRAQAVDVLTRGITALLPELYAQGCFEGVLALGGSGGTAIAASAMRALPLGVPKLIVSTVAAGSTAQYIGGSDLILMPAITDIAGLNHISKTVFDHAAGAMAGMLSMESRHIAERPCIAATMYGVTTPCIDHARALLARRGYEVVVFHATGTGGQTMENLIRAGSFAGVLDITTTEWADELFGGIMGAGPHRCEAAAQGGIPQVVSVGACDMVTFWAHVPAKFAQRRLYSHNSAITLMRTTPEECTLLGQKLAEKLNMATGPTALLLPLKSVSLYDAPGQAFYDPQADAALFSALRANIASKVELIELEYAINDEAFAQAAVNKLLAYL